MAKEKFITLVPEIARSMGYTIERNRDGLDQIDFGHKKLHAGHLAKLYPEILLPGARVSALINQAAPGRPCTHRPMKAIIDEIFSRNFSC